MKTIKRFILLTMAFGFAISTIGQTDPGKFLLGGSSNLNLNLSTTKWKDDNGSGSSYKTTSINFMPKAGIFVAKGLAVGLNIDFSYSVDKNSTTSDKSSMTNIGGSPFVRFYIGPGKIKPFFQGHIGGGISTFKDMPNGGTTTKTKESTFIWGLSGGIAMFLNDHVSLDLGLGFSSTTYKEKQNNPDNLKTFDRIIGLNLGIVTIL
jgi:hypothetical protein